MNKIKVCEVFKAVQGEGPETGTPTVFVRLSGCNMVPPCKWCDSRYHKIGDFIEADDLVKRIERYNLKHVTFTGGEPLLQAESLVKVVFDLSQDDYIISLETNGTIFALSELFDHISVSPKKQKIDLRCLKKYNENTLCIFKFVYEPNQPRWWEGVIKKVGIDDSRVYIMPEGKTRQEQIDRMLEVINYCLEKGYRFSPRIQVLAFDMKRKV